MTMTPRIICLAFFVCIIGSVPAQSLKEGLDLLNVNKRAEARNVLLKIPRGSNEFADALLALTLIDIDNGHTDDAFDEFKEFFKICPNPYPYVYALWNRDLFTGNSVRTADSVKDFMQALSH